VNWFRDAKFGIFLHWGAYSVPAWAEPIGELGTFDSTYWFSHCPYAEWYWNTSQIEGSPAYLHHRSVHGGRPYDEFLDSWHAGLFDPTDLAALFARAGARYVIPTTKHHDGITLWDAPGTGTRNTVHRGPRRDLVAELAGAVRAAGLRFGVYYSGGIDWYAGRRAVIRHESQIDDHGRANEAAYAAYALAQVRDLIVRYRPDVLWNDIGWPDLGLDDLPALFADYRAVVPDGVVNDRWDGTHAARPSVSYDFLTSEYQANRGNEGTGAWENCRGIGYSFGFNQVEGPAHCLSTAAAVRLLADIVSRGGNLLLNVGPRSDGTLPPRQRAVLEGMASWMAVNSVAIHDTRPLPEASPGDTPWLRWTRSADHVYALVADVPAGEVLLRHPDGLANPVRLDGGPVTARTVPGATAVAIDAVGPLPVTIRFGLSA
jgi:alpha-L-fucosidase